MTTRDFMCIALTNFGIGTPGVAPECVGKTVPVSMAGLQLYTGEAVNALTFMLNAAAQMLGSSMTINQLRALNAARCAVTSLGENTWTFLASAYFASYFGGNAKTASIMSACSEAAQKAGISNGSS